MDDEVVDDDDDGFIGHMDLLWQLSRPPAAARPWLRREDPAGSADPPLFFWGKLVTSDNGWLLLISDN